ncbi:MAG: cupredoxin domain-containing protein [Gammaproteobacteria bacterium]
MKRLVTLITLILVNCLAQAEDSSAFQATINANGEQEVRIEASSYTYSPNNIIVKSGIPVVLKINKVGLIPHDFIINDPASGIVIQEKLGKATEIRFTPQNIGEFPFYCGKKLLFSKSHQEKGMHGVLRVQE